MYADGSATNEQEAEEHAIDREWSGSIKTIGTVRIGKNGLVNGGRITAGTIALWGNIESGEVKVFRCLQVHEDGKFTPKAVEAEHLLIAGDANVSYTRKLKFKNIEIAGSLKARIDATGVITVRAGGLLSGNICGNHLVVEEGGGLQATLAISPDK